MRSCSSTPLATPHAARRAARLAHACKASARTAPRRATRRANLRRGPRRRTWPAYWTARYRWPCRLTRAAEASPRPAAAAAAAVARAHLSRASPDAPPSQCVKGARGCILAHRACACIRRTVRVLVLRMRAVPTLAFASRTHVTALHLRVRVCDARQYAHASPGPW